MKHKYTDEEIQAAIDEACNTTTNPGHTNLVPEPQPPTADGKTPGQVLYEILKTTNIAWGELAEWSREDIKDAAQAFLAAAREGFVPAAADWKARHDELQKAYAEHADVTAALHAKVQKAEAELADLRKDNAHLRAACDIFQDGSMSTLRPIAEAGTSPAGCVRLTGARNDAGTWELAEAPATSFDTHCADFYLPDEAKTPAAETFEAHGKTWNVHVPGDERPCEGKKKIDILDKLGGVYCDHPAHHHDSDYWTAEYWNPIVGWRYADEPTPAAKGEQP